jgi:hypothetical protein
MLTRSFLIVALSFFTGFGFVWRAAAGAYPTDSGGDYVIIYREEFQSAITPLVSWRANHGHTVVAKTFESIRNEYPGAPDQSVKDFITYAYNNWSKKPEYVFLIGGYGSFATHMINYPIHGAYAPWEDWFGCMDEDYLPEIAIGRLPVYVAGKVEQYVDRIIYYESHTGEGWKSNAYLAADDWIAPEGPPLPKPWYQMVLEAVNSIESRLPPYYATDIDLRTEFGTEQSNNYDAYVSLKSHFDAGAGIVIFTGTTSAGKWQGFLNDIYTGTVQDIDNFQKYPVIICPTCATGNYTHSEGCIGRDFLREQKGNGDGVGSVVYFGQVLGGYFDYQTHMGNSLLDSFFHYFNDGPTIGKYMLAAKRRLAGKSPEYKETVQSFCLLGDPATVLDLPAPKLPVLLPNWPYYLSRRPGGLAVADLTPEVMQGVPNEPPPFVYPPGDPKHVVCGSDNRVEGSIGVFAFNTDASKRFHMVAGDRVRTAIVDIDADGKLDVITVRESGEVKAFDENGYLIPGLAFTIPGYSSYWHYGPAFGDINRDGYLEFVVADDNQLFAIDRLGQMLDGWPVFLPSGYKPVGSPAVGDLDNDGYLEIVVSTHQGDHSYLCVYGSNGIPKGEGWPKYLSHVMLTAPALADISDDGTVEIVAAGTSDYGTPGYDGRYFVFDYSGAKLVDKLLTGYSFPYTPSVGNFVPVPEWPGKEAVLAAHSADPQENFVLAVAADGTSPFIRNTIPLGNKSPSSAPTIGDVNDFPTNEVVIGCGGRLMAYDLYCGLVPFQGEWNGHLHDAVSSPIVTDLDGDQLCDIVCSDTDGVYAFTTNTMYNPLSDYDWIRENHDNLNMGLYDIAAPTGLVAEDKKNDQGGAIALAWTPSVDCGVRSSRVNEYKIYRTAGEAVPPGDGGFPGDRALRKKLAEGRRAAALWGDARVMPASLESGGGGPRASINDGSRDAGVFHYLTSVYPPYCSYVDEGLENGKLYEYYVMATDGTHKSQRSVIVYAVPEDNIPPAPPTNFDLEIVWEEPPIVILTWTRSVDDPLYQLQGPDDSAAEKVRAMPFGTPWGTASSLAPAAAGVFKPRSDAASAGASDAGGSGGFAAYAPTGGGGRALPLSEKEGEAFKAKVGEGRRNVGTYYPTTAPKLWTGREGGFDAGANDVETYVITKCVSGGSPEIIEFYPDTPGNDVEYWDYDVIYGKSYDYWVCAKDSKNFSETVGPLVANLTQPPPPGGDSLAFMPPGAPASGSYLPYGGDAFAAAGFVDSGWGASRTKAAKVVTCKPNPVTGTATFTITLPAATQVRLDVYDLSGRRVDTVLDRRLEAGGESVVWQPRVANGVYIYKLETPSKQYAGKVVVAR